MFRTIAIVPVRGHPGGKTRLAPLFGESDRAALVDRMAWHVVSAIHDAGVADLTVIVSRNRTFRLTTNQEIQALHYIVQPERAPGLNAALDYGRNWALRHGADRLLVMSADLPLLEPADVQELADLRAPVVIAPDRFATGTNGLMLGDPRRSVRDLTAEFPFRFGIGSFQNHLAEAHRLGIAVDTASSPGTGFDLDTPDDWNRLPPQVQQRLRTPPNAIPVEDCAATGAAWANHGALAESR